MPDTEFFKGPRMKEIREWGTFCLSLLTVIALPVGYVVLHNARLEIMNEVSQKYVAKDVYEKDSMRQEQERGQMQVTIGIVQGKVESIQLEQIHQADSLSMIKEQLSSKNRP